MKASTETSAGHSGLSTPAFFAATLAVAVLFFALLAFIGNEYLYFASYVVLQFVVLATAWNILGGYCGYVNFGSAAFFAIGAYTTVCIYSIGTELSRTFFGGLISLTPPAVLVPIMIVLAGVGAFMIFPEILGPVGAAERQLSLGPSLLALPLLFTAQAIFTLGLGYLFAALNLFLRDVYHLVGVFITVWMFATPIFWPPDILLDPTHPEKMRFSWILDVNPMHWLISCYREILIFGAWPDWFLLGKFALIGGVLLFLGSRFFLSQKPQFPDLL